MNALIEMTQLARTMPGPDATPAEIAAWQVAKGRLHEHLCSTAPTPSEAAHERAYAAGAFDRARALLGGGL